MKRSMWVGLALLAVAACQSEPTFAPSNPSGPSLQIKDGNQGGGSPDFLWIAPMVATGGGFGGTFKNNIAPTVAICKRNAANTACLPGPSIYNASTSPAVTVGANNYQLNWTVPVDAAQVYYRVSVQVDGPGRPSVQLGFADVKSVSPPSRGQPPPAKADPSQFVTATDGTVLGIKFRVLTHCTATPCGESIISRDQGGTVFFYDGTTKVGGVDIPPQGDGGGPVTVTIQRCPDGNLPVDIPLFGSCLQVLTNPEISGDNELDPDNPGKVFVCDVEVDPNMPSGDQHELITLHRQHSASDPVEALPHTTDVCSTPSFSAATDKGSFRGFVRALAQGRFKEAGRQLFGWVAPKPVYARRLDQGAGGETSEFSFFQFGLPSKMEQYSQESQPDGSILVKVRATDLVGAPYSPPYGWVGDGLVKGATVHFDTPDGSVSPADVVTGADGIAATTWSPPSEGWSSFNILHAAGAGIADPFYNGPRNADLSSGSYCNEKVAPETYDCYFDPFIPLQNLHYGFSSILNPSGETPPDPLEPETLQQGVVYFYNYGSSSSGSPEAGASVTQSDLQVGPLRSRLDPRIRGQLEIRPNPRMIKRRAGPPR